MLTFSCSSGKDFMSALVNFTNLLLAIFPLVFANVCTKNSGEWLHLTRETISELAQHCMKLPGL